jgi:hypothetical protein
VAKMNTSMSASASHASFDRDGGCGEQKVKPYQ